MNRRNFISTLVGAIAMAAIPFTTKPLPQYSIHGTVTGRFSSGKPNFEDYIRAGNRFGKTQMVFECDLALADQWVLNSLS